MGGFGAFRAHGGGGCGFADDSRAIPPAGSVLGTDYDMVITQSSLGAAFDVSWQRLVGTVLGALLGAIAATYFAPNVVVLGICVFILGLLRVIARLELLAYRFAGMTLAIVFLIPRTGNPWQIAFHRMAEVSIGIAVALILAWVWPENEAVLSEKRSIVERFLGKAGFEF